ncbi:hypothetical protein R1sor_005894 [Riccia sorocarpa]|uniref:Uncharacterized protein n=1 Tax=Riccia sorocarpa TaxID=122646 RepID=A0ABD3HLD7_9MARC
MVPAAPKDPMELISEVDEKKLLKVDHDKYKTMYPFGTDAVFSVPVEKIEEAPSIFVYRSVNEKYVMDTFKRMIKNSTFIPQIADLLPLSLSKEDSNNEQAYFVPSFVECLRQTRSQWIDLNRPQGAQGSNKKNPVFEQFKSTVSQTMGRKSYKEFISLVCCSDDIFKEFENFVGAWEKGEIPDVYGALGKPKGERDVGEVLRDFSQLSVNRFRPVNGLPDEDLKLVWSQLAQGSVWVSRPAKYQGLEDIVALKEYCKALKGKDKLGKAIVRYWTTRYQEDFNTWGQLAVSYTIPEPWLGEMLKYLPEKPEKEEKQKFSCFLSIVKELTSSEGFAIVAVMEFGKQLVSFSAVLKELKDARVLMECGGYEGPRLQRSIDLLSPSWQLVYAYVSFGPEDYKPLLCSTEGLHPTCNEFATKKGLEDVEPEKGENTVQLNLKNKLPRWEFVNLSSPDDEPLTHPLCKRRGFCYRMIVNYSEEDSTVLDFFSGGIFTREALFSHRDVIYFAHSEKEAIFVKEYAKALLHCSNRVRSWYERYKSLKVPTSSSPPPALASSSQQPGLASTSQQPARAVADEDEIEDTDAAKFVFDADVENEARTNFGNARRRVAFNKNIV